MPDLKRNYEFSGFCQECEKSGKSKLDCAKESFFNRGGKNTDEFYIDNEIKSGIEFYSNTDKDIIKKQEEVKFIEYNCGYDNKGSFTEGKFVPGPKNNPGPIDALFYEGGISDGFSDFIFLCYLCYAITPFVLFYAILVIAGIIFAIHIQKKKL